MRCAFILIFSLGLFASLATAQTDRVPLFNEHPASISNTVARDIDFRSHKDARMFRTRLREALRGGVNFAGRYIVATWGCGTGCVSGAIIEARTGKVFFPKELSPFIAGNYYDDDDKPIEYRRNSSLLIMDGAAGTGNEVDEPSFGKYYLVWKGNSFEQLRFEPRQDPR